GLHAPPEKVTVIPFTVPPDAPVLRTDTVLFAENALWQWFTDEAQFRRLADAFGKWRKALGPVRLLIKPHPNFPPSEYQRQQLEPYELVTDRASVEELAGRLDAATVVGTCTTALFTLKLMRPELRCVDFGSDVYVPHAYFGDDSVVKTLAGVGVEILRVGSGGG
ncbi:MAG TPA: hypothetical protein PKE47_02555, partial [Verrucomicrobiota bacterium]|nr:hypothetical protein [Verrucomicrobiota bacterium]